MPRLCPNNRPFDDTGLCTCGEGHQDQSALADDLARIAGVVLETEQPICPVCDQQLNVGDHCACVAPLVSGSSKHAS